MKNWKDFYWTDENGNTLPHEYKFAAIDSNGDCYAYKFDRFMTNDDGWLVRHQAAGIFVDPTK